jgi:hypothetical protein
MNRAAEQKDTNTERHVVEIESVDEEPGSASAEVMPFREPKSAKNATSGEDIPPASAPRSGGPRTGRGKEKSSRNALTHRIFAKVTVFDDEPRAEYEALLQGYRDHFEPVGTVEDVHVQQLVNLMWRYRRLQQAEGAEIQCEQRFNSRAVERRLQERGEAAILDVSTTGQKYGLLEGRQNPLVLRRVVELLESLEASIEFRGFEPENDHAIIDRVFGGNRERCPLRGAYELCRDNSRAAHVPELKSFDLHPDARKEKFLGHLRYEINKLKREQTKLKRSSEERQGLERQSSFVPEPARLDRLLRYGTSLLRDYDRCLNQLERLQRARRGLPVPPTLNVNVSA